MLSIKALGSILKTAIKFRIIFKKERNEKKHIRSCTEIGAPSAAPNQHGNVDTETLREGKGNQDSLSGGLVSSFGELSHWGELTLLAISKVPPGAPLLKQSPPALAALIVTDPGLCCWVWLSTL